MLKITGVSGSEEKEKRTKEGGADDESREEAKEREILRGFQAEGESDVWWQAEAKKGNIYDKALGRVKGRKREKPKLWS